MPANEIEPAYVSVIQAATYANVSHMTIRRMIADGRLPAWRVGHSIRIKVEDMRQIFQPVEVA